MVCTRTTQLLKVIEQQYHVDDKQVTIDNTSEQRLSVALAKQSACYMCCPKQQQHAAGQHLCSYKIPTNRETFNQLLMS